ncbi:MAG: helix-hairpin-helix domain-containing protein [Candidatus Bathyarchaeota archaeon]|uniref:helix-hairpin-helix domain-containing protein n=1 Tax=Candidatus Bathycorpusculum sp. TaxID=2994959 RepID=UPI00281C754A|nr:helix-hairpin-helix domain-containing protein [Candidatus Termiticorpusculum sp.]MCL2257000.1 helix-hairpin-helix domain-containing protein [Candidatus Termiticorpusculum sp.]MCL2292876.1 helix-hairpin-helix domain-containing protein [Candidatus Termiticorpusculum sp.]
MRSDVTLYIVAAFFFTTAIAATVLFADMYTRLFWIALSITLGVITTGAGYTQKPIVLKPIKTLQTTTDESTPTQTITQENIAEEVSVKDSPFTEPVPAETIQQTVEEETTPDVISEEPTLSFTQEEQIPTVTAQDNVADVAVTAQDNVADVAVTAQDDLSVVAQDDTIATMRVELEEIPLTSVKGVREKRALQLNALGIYTVKELSQASVETLTKGLRPISPKQAGNLIEAAKQQLKQA